MPPPSSPLSPTRLYELLRIRDTGRYRDRVSALRAREAGLVSADLRKLTEEGRAAVEAMLACWGDGTKGKA